MPHKYKDSNGFPVIDHRETLDEWVKRAGGRFGILIALEVRDEDQLWAKLRTTTEWEPKWFKVDDEVIFSRTQLVDYQKGGSKHDQTLPGVSGIGSKSVSDRGRRRRPT